MFVFIVYSIFTQISLVSVNPIENILSLLYMQTKEKEILLD